MARPAKSVKVKTGAIAGDDAAIRASVEDKLRGKAVVKLEPPEGLSSEQKEIFRTIVDGLAAGEILGRLDVFVLESTAVTVDRLRVINSMIDRDPNLLLNTSLQNSRAKYQSDLWRGCSELCLSPQARAKLGGMAAQKAREKKDPLLEALKADD